MAAGLKDDADGKEKAAVANDRPTVRMLVIEKDGAPTATTTPAPKKKI